MATFKTNITIQAPLERVWSMLADIGNIYQWNPTVKHSESTTESAQGLGAGRHCELGGNDYLDETVVEWEPNQRLTVRVTGTNLPLQRAYIRFDLSEAEQGNQGYGFARLPGQVWSHGNFPGLLLRAPQPGQGHESHAARTRETRRGAGAGSGLTFENPLHSNLPTIDPPYNRGSWSWGFDGLTPRPTFHARTLARATEQATALPSFAFSGCSPETSGVRPVLRALGGCGAVSKPDVFSGASPGRAGAFRPPPPAPLRSGCCLRPDPDLAGKAPPGSPSGNRS